MNQPDPMPEEALARPREEFPLRVWIAGGCAGLLLVLFVMSWILPKVLQNFATTDCPKAKSDVRALVVEARHVGASRGAARSEA